MRLGTAPCDISCMRWGTFVLCSRREEYRQGGHSVGLWAGLDELGRPAAVLATLCMLLIAIFVPSTPTWMTRDRQFS